MERKSFSYDKYSDSLIVSNKQENEIVKNNFEIGDIVFSLTGKGKIVSIEIRGVTSFLESCGIDAKILSNIKDVALNIIPKRNSIFIILKIESVEGQQMVIKDIPLVMPLVN